jgi:hypothetical protein
VAHNGLHCGPIFEIPGHHTWLTGERDTPPNCPPGEAIPGLTHEFHSAHTGAWNYWTKEGKWVLWDGGWRNAGYWHNHHERYVVTRIEPDFHNWGSEAWPVRVYFECKPI